MPKTKTTSQLIGVAGEYFVAAELTRRGYIASITLRNSDGIDILCSNQQGDKTVSIQVKTNNRKEADWMLNAKAEIHYNNNFFYIFVILNVLHSLPSYYIVPSKDVAEFIFSTHREWLKGKKSDGTPRKDSDMRKFRDPEHVYKDKWELLGLDL